MALLPFFGRDNVTPPSSWDLSPWRDLDRLNEFGGVGGAGFIPQRFRSHVGSILREMDDSIARMDDEMRKVMRTSTGKNGYDSGSLLTELHTISPSISQQPDGLQIAHYDFDVSGFQPEEITIKTQDNTLEVIARHEVKSPGREVSREFRRTFTIPQGISPDELQGRLLRDAVLRVEAPYRPPALTQQPEVSRLIPITHQ
jgi:HSP20 family molecular chaperone IbpA